ncbi:hypothetical protein Taro_007513 [Colocasia esculenta]|uniref:Transcription repressor n=1 Tax=Colocasia esculenta TaxID=4460 RepID=A0A843TVM7_COLES|nr:hypothetical protein [Colocasia esculenta]
MERGRLKQRLSQMFRASLRSSCSISSRDVADAVQEPIFVSRRYDGDDDEEVLPGLDRSLSLPPASLGSLLYGRTVAPAASQRLSVDCSCRPGAMALESLKKLKKKERRMPKIGASYEAGDGRTCPPASPVSPSPSYYYLKQMEEEMEREEKWLAAKKKKEIKEKRKGKKLLSNGYGFTSSSSEGSDNDDVGDCFSSDGAGGASRDGKVLRERDKDTEVLFSSRSISSDSSEFYHTSRRHTRNKKRTSRGHQKPRRGDGTTGRSRHSSRDDGFRPLVSISSSATGTKAAAALLTEEEDMGIRKEGFAVEKESSDPYEDFRSSMLEMIVEKQMFGAAELEHLLRCYLALNNPCHHPIIVEVFSEIWETLFRN